MIFFENDEKNVFHFYLEHPVVNPLCLHILHNITTKMAVINNVTLRFNLKESM